MKWHARGWPNSKARATSTQGRRNARHKRASSKLAQEREQRIGQALARLPEMAAVKLRNGQKAEDARASSTDADASNMKMADGGFRPAYNVQFASDCEAQVIVGVEVVTAGSDMAQLAPMVEQVERRLGRAPEQWLVDGGFPAHGQIDAVQHKTEVYAPVPEAKKKAPKKAKTDKDAGGKDEQGDPGTQDAAVDKHAAKPGDSAAVAQWRQRMGSDEAKQIYKERAATAECVNAQARQRGLNQMPVRGLARVKCVARLYVLAHNLMRMAVLAPHLIGWGMGASAAAITA